MRKPSPDDSEAHHRNQKQAGDAAHRCDYGPAGVQAAVIDTGRKHRASRGSNAPIATSLAPSISPLMSAFSTLAERLV